MNFYYLIEKKARETGQKESVIRDQLSRILYPNSKYNSRRVLISRLITNQNKMFNNQVRQIKNLSTFFGIEKIKDL